MRAQNAAPLLATRFPERYRPRVDSEQRDAHRAKLVERLEWLDRSVHQHQESQKHSPRYIAAIALALPVGWLWGVALATGVVLVVVSFVSLLYYVAWNHQVECESERESIRAMLRQLERAT